MRAGTGPGALPGCRSVQAIQAEDLAGGGPGAAAVVNAVAERGGQVCFGHGEDFFHR